jgi:hypothetical protein
MLKAAVIVLGAICFGIALQSAPNLAAGPVSGFQEQKQQSELEVRISPLKNVVVSGETLQLRVEMWNVGSDDLFICSDFNLITAQFCTLTLSFEPRGKGPRALSAADVGFPNENRKSFVDALVRNWISIPPGHYYGAIVELNPTSYPELSEVGGYRLQGRYISGGLLTPRNYNDLQAYPNEVARLPGKSWHGKVDTNSAVVHVISNKK